MSAGTDSPTSVESAISHVLGAEQDAVAQIAVCEGRAEQILQDAHQVVRAMVRRADERIRRLRVGCAERTSEMIDDLERAAGAGDERPLPDDAEQEALLKAVRAVARELTTREPSNVG